MAPLSRPVTEDSSQEVMNCESQTEGSNKRACLTEACPASLHPSSAHRRVIFPSLYSKPCEEDSDQSKTEDIVIVEKSPATDFRQQQSDAPPLRPFSSSDLPVKSSRLCDELGLDVPSRSLGDTSKPKAPDEKYSVTRAPSKLTRNDEDQKLLDALSSSFALHSPSLSSKSHRLCDELGLEAPSVPLSTGESINPKIRLIPKSKATNRQHFAPNPSPAVPPSTRTSSGNRVYKSPPRRSRIDLGRLAKSSPTPRILPSSCPTSPQERRPSILRHGCKRGTSPGSLPLAPPNHEASSSDKALSSDKVLPSLVPCGEGSASSNDTLHSLPSQTSSSEHSDFVPGRLTRAVSFDARVWVHEYERAPGEAETAWFTPEELEHFRKQTVARLVAHNTELLPSGTGFVVQRGNMLPSKAVFAMPFMSAVAEDDDDDAEADESEVENAVNAEIQNILVVDPHDLCAKLFRRDLKRMIKTVNVRTAFSSLEARKQLSEMKRVDVVIVEERLNHLHRNVVEQTAKGEPLALSSGSDFIKELAQERAAAPPEENCLFIAVSSHLDKDKQKMRTSGADFIWAKPPPKMDEIVRDVLLKALLIKREKRTLADRLFGTVMGSP